MDKFCKGCEETKQSTQFYTSKNVKDGLHSICKACASLRAKDRREIPGNKERAKIAVRQWRANPKNARANLSTAYKTKYGISLEEYEDLLEKQENKCAICNNTHRYNGKPLYVDHCHNSGKIRKLLCQHCNSGLGMFKDNPELLLKAADYLKEHND